MSSLFVLKWAQPEPVYMWCHRSKQGARPWPPVEGVPAGQAPSLCSERTSRPTRGTGVSTSKRAPETLGWCLGVREASLLR